MISAGNRPHTVKVVQAQAQIMALEVLHLLTPWRAVQVALHLPHPQCSLVPLTVRPWCLQGSGQGELSL